jgi:hypothetical protein
MVSVKFSGPFTISLGSVREKRWALKDKSAMYVIHRNNA